jgi:hypothetical protein
MHRSQTLSATTGAGCGLLAADVAVAWPTARGANNANRMIEKSRGANCFLMRGSLSSLQGFTFLYGLFTWD